MRTLILILLNLMMMPALTIAATPQKYKITKGQLDAALATIPKYAPDRILVRFTPSTPAVSIQQSHQLADGRVLTTVPGINVQVVKVPKGLLVDKLRAYRANPNVEFAEPDYNRLLVIPTEGTDLPPPNGTGVDFFPEQWGLNNTGQLLVEPNLGQAILTGTPDADIDAPEGWDVHTGDANVKIAILDSGVDCSSVDLAGKCVEQTSFVTRFSPTTDDLVGHGTHVAGIAAANVDNSKGTAGVGWNSSIGNLKVCYEYELDLLPPLGIFVTVGVCPVSASADAITYAADNDYHVINMSYQSDVVDPDTGEPVGLMSPPNVESAAVTYAWNKGVVIVAAAGNEPNTDLVYPAALSEVIAVAATDRYDNLASFSTFGNTWVSMMAPGENILSTEPDIKCVQFVPGYIPGVDDCLTWKSGTSMASPHVAGAAALLWSHLYPGQSPGDCTASNGMPCNSVVRTMLEDSADTSGALAQNFLAWSQNGRLNLYNMLADGDGDSILSPVDNCPDINNPDQTDTDSDLKGNACDLDDDNDAVLDLEDNCPLVSNFEQINSDYDDVGDACDNCMLTTNADQRDNDGDYYGNVCDPDFDNNQIVNAADLAWFTTRFFSPDPNADLNGDGVVNAADLVILKKMYFSPPGPSGLLP